MIAPLIDSERPKRCLVTAGEWSIFNRSGLCTIVTIVATAGGCDRPTLDDITTEAAPTVTIRDSAGIEIVENHAPEYAPDEFWTIDPVPEFVLGGANTLGEPAHDSAQLIWRVKGLARVEDGRVAVLSSGNKHLMLFEPSGELSVIMGGPGEGPGEFIHPLAFQYLPPDTLVVWDFFLTSIGYFNTDGTLLKERSLDHGRMWEHGVNAELLRLPLPDGSFLAAVLDSTVDDSPDDCSGLTVRGVSFAMMGSPLRVEGVTVPGEELLRIDDAYRAHSFGCAQYYSNQLAVGGDPPLVYISNDHSEIHQRSLDGTLSRIIRRTTGPPPVTRRAWRAESEHRARNNEMWGRSPRTEDDEPVPRREEYPAVEAIMADVEGYLWVKEWSASESGIPDQWSVFSPEGRWLGTLPVPPNPASPDLDMCGKSGPPCWVGKDYFVIVREDELGVERVEGYRIRRDRTGGSVPP